MLVLSLALGSGVTALDQTPGLDQFETESEEADALDYVDDNFGTADNETTAQIVVRDENALSRDSLLATLELQRDFRENETVNETLADEDAFSDLSSIVASTAIQQELADDLEERGDELEETAEELEERGEELEEDRQELEQRGEELEERGEELEERGEELEEDRQELEQRSQQLEEDQALLEQRSQELEEDQQELDETAETLTELLQETQTLQEEYEELNATYEQGLIEEEEYEAEAAELEAEFDVIEAQAEGALDDEGAETFLELMDELRAAVSTLAALERGEPVEEDPEALEAIYGEIEETILADEIQGLEARGEQLEEDQQELEARGEQLEEDADELEARGEQLEEDAAELDEDAEQLDEDAEQLEERGEQLEEDADELEERREQLGDEFDELEEGIETTLEEEIEKLEEADEDELEDAIDAVLGEDAENGAFAFVPSDFDPGETSTDARTIFVTQEMPVADAVEGEAPEEIVESQLTMSDLVDERFGDDGFVFGVGIITDEIDRSLFDSFAIVLPLALLFVAVVLTIAYRDLLDILLGLFGIVLVLLWTFGFMGWSGIDFNQIMIAVPVLLVGLSIDYAIHVFMRHREQRGESDDGTRGTRPAMAIVLGGLGVAFLWVTATAVIGFLSNLVSPVAPIREFGVASAFGIASAFAIFAVLVPAMKVALDDVLERRGIDRRKRAFGTGGGRVSGVLLGGQRVARRAPWTVVIVVFFLTTGGVAGATQLDTSFEQEDFIADDPPEWMDSLPEPFAPGEYAAKENLEFVDERFLRGDTQSQVLVQGDVTADDTLERIDEAESLAADGDATVILADGSADVDSPLSVMESVAAENESFNETFTDADTTGDDVPDTDLESVYDALYEADEDAAADVVYRADDEYEALLLTVSVRGGASSDLVDAETRDVAAVLDGNGLEATATGQVIVFGIIEDELFQTVLESLLVTLVAVFAFLMLAYRRYHGSAILGAITLLPIVLSVTWILGTMYLLEIPFNVMTGTITSLTVGLGVAYNIHMAERYVLERRRGRDLWEALSRSVTGTGGALFGSAATTVGGFGVLTFAILPPLQQFGLITGLTITYAFLGSVFVLPTFLVLWTRYVGPQGGFSADLATADDATGPAYANGSGQSEERS